MSGAPVTLRHPEWTRSAAIYQLNTRQFTREGTFDAAARHLPRLRDLGVGIVWLMPVHSIGERHRKGTLGSPYSVRDHYSVNPEFGTLDDLERFVREAHGLGLRVIIDWVANHTAWDHPLAAAHPEWYARDWKGDFRPTPWWDWTDIIDLDYSREGVRRYMADAMKYWVARADVDGYRCDVAGFVPLDFWNQVRRELDAIKPVFMLAEWEARDLHAAAFDATYAWSWYTAVQAVASGRRRDLGGVYSYYATNECAYPRDCMRLTFLSNHDKNAWDGTEFEQFGPAVEPAMVLSVVGDGLPLIYNGQEAGSRKRLAFFEKDEIAWGPHRNGELYRQLLALKHRCRALWNGAWGATMIAVPNSEPASVLSFVRRHADEERVFAVINFSGEPRDVTFGDGPHLGGYTEYLSGRPAHFAPGTAVELGPWESRLFTS